MTDLIPHQSHSVIPSGQQLSEMFRLSEQLCKTNFVPDAYRGKPAETLACILYGAELGLGPMQSLAQISPIKGTPSMKAELMRALVRSAGHRIETISDPDSATECVLRGTRIDGTTEVSSFSIEDAKRAGLANGSNYKTYPKAMLLARATSQLCRSLFADVISGISYTPEELISIDAPSQPVDVAPIELTDGEVSANDAKRQLVEACGGDVERAKAIWNEHGTDPITQDTLDELLALAIEVTETVEVTEADELFGDITEAEVVA